MQGLVPITLKAHEWPDRHVPDKNGFPAPFHLGQRLAFDSEERIIAMLAGSQGGKTGFGPFWLWSEIEKRGSGDYIAVTATYDLFKLKMLPALLDWFEHHLQVARYWAGDRVLEILNPLTGKFQAKKVTDKMWARIILRSADALGGLESATAKGAWLDEAGQVSFGLSAYRAVRRRLALHTGRILITTTLYDITWVDDEIIKRCEHGGSKVSYEVNSAELEHTVNNETSISLIQFDSILNPAYPHQEFNEAKETMPEDEFNMFYRGRMVKPRTLIYDSFDADIHVIPRFNIPPHWPRYAGLDFGGTNTAAVFYAEDPATKKLFCYRIYHEGGRLSLAHAQDLKKGEPLNIVFYGGAAAEDQWRSEFSVGGLYVRQPMIAEKWLGITIVYACHVRSDIFYFSDLYGLLEQKKKYKRPKDKNGNIIMTKIENEKAFHFLDAERYVISSIRSMQRPLSVSALANLGSVEDYDNPWA